MRCRCWDPDSISMVDDRFRPATTSWKTHTSSTRQTEALQSTSGERTDHALQTAPEQLAEALFFDELPGDGVEKTTYIATSKLSMSGVVASALPQ